MGAIVHNSTGTTLSVSNTTSFTAIDLDGVGGNDWQLFLGGYGNIAAYASHSYNGLGATVATGAGNAYAINLDPGFVVGPPLVSGVFNSNGARWYYF